VNSGGGLTKVEKDERAQKKANGKKWTKKIPQASKWGDRI